MLSPELITKALNQHHCLTRAQLLEQMTKHQIWYLVQSGVLVQKHTKVFALGGSPDTWHQRAAAAVLSVNGSVLSGRSAARWWGLVDSDGSHIEVTVAHGSHRAREKVTVHRAKDIEPWTVEREGVRVFTVARVMVDLARSYEVPYLGRLIDEAVYAKVLVADDLAHCVGVLPRHTPGLTVLRELLATRLRADNRVENNFERDTLARLREAGLPEPVAQYRVIANGSSYRIDLAYPELRIAIEPKGNVHLLPSKAAEDALRSADLAIEHWTEISRLASTNMGDFIGRIRDAYQRRCAEAARTASP